MFVRSPKYVTAHRCRTLLTASLPALVLAAQVLPAGKAHALPPAEARSSSIVNYNISTSSSDAGWSLGRCVKIENDVETEVAPPPASTSKVVKNGVKKSDPHTVVFQQDFVWTGTGATPSGTYTAEVKAFAHVSATGQTADAQTNIFTGRDAYASAPDTDSTPEDSDDGFSSADTLIPPTGHTGNYTVTRSSLHTTNAKTP